VTLLGRATSAHDGVLDIAPNLAESLSEGDAVYTTFLDLVDDHVRQSGQDFPQEPQARVLPPDPPCVTKPLRQLDLRGEDIHAVIWATGYGVDFGWIDIPVLDALGEPVHRHGITKIPGLYFLGLQWLSRMKSSFLSGVGDDAAVLADHIAARG